MNLTHLTDPELETQTLHAARTEQNATLTLLHHLHEVQRRRLFAARGYASLWEYVVKVLNYGESAASHRVGAMRLMYSCGEAREKIEQGELHLSAAATIERFFRNEQRERDVTADEKTAIIREVAGRSARETERVLVQHMARPEIHEREKVRAVAGGRTELRFTVGPETLALLERVKELRNGCLEAIFAEALATYAAKLEPTRQVRPRRSLDTSKVTRYVPRTLKRELHLRAGSRCEFTDPQTTRRCESRSHLQVDHIQPYALGGPTTPENCRLLCPAHNLHKAIEDFGPRKIQTHLTRHTKPDKKSLL